MTAFDYFDTIVPAAPLAAPEPTSRYGDAQTMTWILAGSAAAGEVKLTPTSGAALVSGVIDVLSVWAR